MRAGADHATSVAVVLALLGVGAAASARPPGGTTAFRADEQLVAPAPGVAILGVETSETLRSGWPSFAAVFGHTRDAVTLTADGVPESTVVETRTRATLLAAVGFLERAQIGLTLPFTLATDGAPLGPLGRSDDTVAGSSMGDLVATAKVRLLEPGDAPRDGPVPGDGGGVGLALGVTLGLPTGEEGTFDSYGVLVGRPFIVADWRPDREGPVVSVQVGYAFLPRVIAGDAVIDDTLDWGLGVRVPEVFGDLSVLATATGRLPVTEASSAVVPVELAVGAEMRFGPFVAFAGAGGAVTGEVGAPAFRFLAGFGYTPVARDADGDGLTEDRDGCPREPEDLDGFEDGDGCPDLDNDADGVPDARDGEVDGSGLGRCRDVPEDQDGFEDDDGCPDTDNDGDGVPDQLDSCPDLPAPGQEQGCPASSEPLTGR